MSVNQVLLAGNVGIEDIVPTPSRSATRIESASTVMICEFQAADKIAFSVSPERPSLLWDPQSKASFLAGSVD